MHELRNKIAAVALTISSAVVGTGCSKEESSSASGGALTAHSLPGRPVQGKEWTFEECLAFTLDIEGGHSSNKNDRGNRGGGSTNRGVTQGTYDLYRREHGLSSKSVTRISPEEIRGVYKEFYWVPAGCGKMPDGETALLMFDAAVNHGAGGAVRLLQRALGGVPVDGDFGPKTENALARTGDLEGLKGRFLKKRTDLYYHIVHNDSSQRVFLNGWLNRIDAVREAIAAGRAHGEPTPPPSPEQIQATRPYTVRPGDSLWSIAKHQLHDSARWREIAALNKLNLENPDIKPGQELKLPR